MPHRFIRPVARCAAAVALAAAALSPRARAEEPKPKPEAAHVAVDRGAVKPPVVKAAAEKPPKAAKGTKAGAVDPRNKAAIESAKAMMASSDRAQVEAGIQSLGLL